MPLIERWLSDWLMRFVERWASVGAGAMRAWTLGSKDRAGFQRRSPSISALSTATVLKKAIYTANTEEAIRRSVFGSPTYFVDGDMFYGQDRLELVERALKMPFAGNWPPVELD